MLFKQQQQIVETKLQTYLPWWIFSKVIYRYWPTRNGEKKISKKHKAMQEILVNSFILKNKQWILLANLKKGVQ